MTLRRYLLTIYLVTLGYLAILIALTASDTDFPLAGMLMLSPFIALANTFINVWPWARMVSPERRTSFRAYRTTNIFMGLVGVLVLVCIVLKIAEVAGA